MLCGGEVELIGRWVGVELEPWKRAVGGLLQAVLTFKGLKVCGFEGRL
jgi:hypothetical protein